MTASLSRATDNTFVVAQSSQPQPVYPDGEPDDVMDEAADEAEKLEAEAEPAKAEAEAAIEKAEAEAEAAKAKAEADAVKAKASAEAAKAGAEGQEKEAYEAAKELGTLEAWEAFLNNFPTGFRADLARAYLKRIAAEAPAAPEEVVAPPPAPKVTTEKEAYEAAKELGTLEAWEAFLNNFPTGFRADLARAYLKRVEREAPAAAIVPPAPPVEEYVPVEDYVPVTPVPEATPVAPPPPPASPADISITTTANQTSCSGGKSCSYTVVATNTGGTAFSGELVIANSLAPRGATLTSTGNAPWDCEGMGGGAICTNASVYLAPGESSNLSLTFKLPSRASGSVTSCASISWGGVPSASSVKDVQQALNDLGHNVGRPDGKAGRKTASAIREFQSDNGLQETGEVDLPLLIVLFTEPGVGDGDGINDQACTGSSVIAAPTVDASEPRVEYCGGGRVRDPSGDCACPSTYPHWTGKSCIPRRVRNCIGGTYYSKRQKLCLCPSSRPFWYNDRCHATLDDCPEDGVVIGNTCVQPSAPAGSDGHLLNRRAICPATHTLIGSTCVNLSTAPVFGNRGRGGSGFGRGFGRGGNNAVVPNSGGQQSGSGGQGAGAGSSGGSKAGGSKAGGSKASGKGSTAGGGKAGGAPKAGAKGSSSGGGSPKAATQPSGSSGTKKPAGPKTVTPAKKEIRTCPLGQVVTYYCKPPSGVICRSGAGLPNGGTICFKANSPEEKAFLAKGNKQQQDSKKPGSCPNNMVKFVNGQCGCPADLPQLVGTTCFKTVPGNLIQQNQQNNCVATSPLGIRTSTGACVCPKDRPNLDLVNGTCTAPQLKAGADCGDGRKYNAVAKRCLCPGGLNFLSGSCVRTSTPTLKNGQIVCPAGQTIRPGSRDRGGNGTCVPEAKARQERQIIEDRKKQDLLNKKQAEEQRKAQEIKDNKAREDFLKKKAAEDAAKAKNDPLNCGDGRRRNQVGGRCLCPGGLNFLSGSCVQTSTPVLKNGQLICPAGQTVRPGSRDRGGNGVCVPEAKAQQEQRYIDNPDLRQQEQLELQRQQDLKLQQEQQLQQQQQQNQQPNVPATVEKKAEPAPKKDTTPKVTPKPAPKPKAKPAAKPKPKPKPKAKPAAKSKPKAKAKPKPKAKAKPKPKAKAKAKPKPKPKPKAKAKPKPKPKAKAKPNGKANPQACPAGQIPTANGCVVQPRSDIRLKRDVMHLTTLANGIKLYSFRYLWSEAVQVGVMAQDLLSDPARRDAVILRPDGFYAVDYTRLGLRMATLAEWHARGLASVRLKSVDGRLSPTPVEHKQRSMASGR